MAQYTHLPIYKTSYDLLYRIMHATKQFPREYKYTLGQELKQEAMGLILHIYRANSYADRASHISMLLERVQIVEVLMRLSHDLRILPRKQYALLCELTDRVGRQASGWLKASGGRQRIEGKT